MPTREFAYSISECIPNLLGKTIDRGRIRLQKMIGRGAWGVVYLGVTSDPIPKQFGVKVVLKDEISSDHCKSLPYEVGMHNVCATASPHIVKLLNVLQHEHEDLLFIITEYCSDGDLLDMIQSGRYTGEDELQKSVFLQILDAVEACHRLSVFHRDLKPENIFCKDGGKTVVLGDFGFATPVEESKEFRIGSQPFMSPEVFGGMRMSAMAYSTRRADVWALGVMLLNLASGSLPWGKATISDPSFRTFVLRDRDYLLHYFPISHELNTILKKIFTADPLDRISLPELREQILKVKKFTTLRRLTRGAQPILVVHNEDIGGDELPDDYMDDSVDMHIEDGIIQVLNPFPGNARTQPVSFDIPVTRDANLAEVTMDDSAPFNTVIVRAPGQPDQVYNTPARTAPDYIEDYDSTFDDDLYDSDSDSDAESEGPITPEQRAVDAVNAGITAVQLEDVPSLGEDEDIIGVGATKLNIPAFTMQKHAPVQELQQPEFPKMTKFGRMIKDDDVAPLGQPSVERMLRNAARMMGVAR